MIRAFLCTNIQNLIFNQWFITNYLALDAQILAWRAMTRDI